MTNLTDFTNNKLNQITLNEFLKIQIGDEVYYREKEGEIAPFLYKARVTGKKTEKEGTLFITLRCAAMINPENDYEDADRYFTTTFAYTDCILRNTGCKLFKAA